MPESAPPLDAAAGPPQPPKFVAPTALGHPNDPRGADVWRGLSYSTPDGYRDLEMDVYVPSIRRAPAPCVIWIHGGAWLFGSRKRVVDFWPEGLLFQSAIDAGLAVVAIDYRHSREAAFPAQLHDAKAALRYVREFSSELGIDAERIGVWGESAGGHLAALLAFTPEVEQLEGDEGVVGQPTDIAALVDFYGISDLGTMPSLVESIPSEWLEELTRMAKGGPIEPEKILLHGSPLPEDERESLASPITHVTASAPPVLLIHGTADHTVPFSQSVELEQRLRNHGVAVELVAIEGADHAFFGSDPMPAIEKAIRFLVETLAPNDQETATT